MDFLCHLVGVQLESDWSLLDALGKWIAPIDYRMTVHGNPDAIALGENFQIIPVMLFAHFLCGTAVDG